MDVAYGEQVVVGTSHVGLFNVKSAWPCARMRVRSGSDGADLELLEVLATEILEQRFDEVVVVSGDGIFADVVAELAGSGVQVTAAAWAASFSSRLRLAACRTVFLDDWVGHHAVREVA